MAIIGALQDGLSGDYSLLLTKAILDGVICMVFASTMGAGVLLAALPLFIYQGLITLCASFISPYLATAIINDICYIGNNFEPMQQELLDKHYLRKHGANAYYGQKKK